MASAVRREQTSAWYSHEVHRGTNWEGDHDGSDRCDNGHRTTQFRKDIEGIDAAALGTARGTPGSRRRWSGPASSTTILVVHAHGEKIAVFPALEEVAPLVAEAYVKDHRGLDEALDA